MLYREHVRRVWKWVILICIGSKPFLTCLRSFFLYIRGFRLFLLLLKLNHLSTCYSPLFSKLRESTQGMAVLTRREVEESVRATLRFASRSEFPPFFRSWLKRHKEGYNPHSEPLKTIWISNSWINLSFLFGKRGVNNFRVTLVLLLDHTINQSFSYYVESKCDFTVDKTDDYGNIYRIARHSSINRTVCLIKYKPHEYSSNNNKINHNWSGKNNYNKINNINVTSDSDSNNNSNRCSYSTSNFHVNGDRNHNRKTD